MHSALCGRRVCALDLEHDVVEEQDDVKVGAVGTRRAVAQGEQGAVADLGQVRNAPAKVLRAFVCHNGVRNSECTELSAQQLQLALGAVLAACENHADAGRPSPTGTGSAGRLGTRARLRGAHVTILVNGHEHVADAEPLFREHDHLLAKVGQDLTGRPHRVRGSTTHTYERALT